MLYYTGASEPGSSQNHAENSLGGYISNSPIANGRSNTIFTNIVASGAQRSTRIIAFHNTGRANQISIHLEVPSDSEHKFQAALVTASLDDDCNNAPYFETLLTEDALPFYASLTDCVGADNKIILDNIADQEWIGIILVREAISTNLHNTLEALEAAYVANPEDFTSPQQPQVVDLSLVIDVI